MSNTNKTNRVVIADIESPVKALTEAEASMVNGGKVTPLLGLGLVFVAWAGVKFWDLAVNGKNSELYKAGENAGDLACSITNCNKP